MSKRHHAKQVAKVQQVVSGECDSLLITAYVSEAIYLEGQFPIKMVYRGSIHSVPGLARFRVLKI